MADDGFPLTLIHVINDSGPTLGPVLLVHGAGVRAEIFRAPVRTTIVDALLGAGYDVWLLNWRGSIEHAANEWNLDEAALFDHPAAVRELVRQTGCETIKAIVHCQGSTSFCMAVVAGLLPEVEVVIANAISLHPVVTRWGRAKLGILVPLLRLLTPYVNPHWGVSSTGLLPWLMKMTTYATHRECDNEVCRLVSFIYGTGHPALWSHELINEATHEWLKQEFGAVPLRLHAQLARSVRHGSLVSMNERPGLPMDYTASAPRSDARFALFTGAQNGCFRPESQRRTFAYLERHRPDFHSLHVVPRYGHLDMFMGEDAAQDVFPLMIHELGRELSSARLDIDGRAA